MVKKCWIPWQNCTDTLWDLSGSSLTSPIGHGIEHSVSTACQCFVIQHLLPYYVVRSLSKETHSVPSALYWHSFNKNVRIYCIPDILLEGRGIIIEQKQTLSELKSSAGNNHTVKSQLRKILIVLRDIQCCENPKYRTVVRKVSPKKMTLSRTEKLVWSK